MRIERNLIDISGGLFFLILGFLSVIFYKRFARKTEQFYSKIRVSRWFSRYYDVEHYEIAYLVGGILFAIFGFLSVFGLIRFR